MPSRPWNQGQVIGAGVKPTGTCPRSTSLRIADAAMKAVAVLFAVASLGACSAGSVTLTCAGLGLDPVTSPDQRFQLPGFSVLPPTGPHWCAKSDSSIVVFSKNLFGGRALQSMPPQEEVAHTFVATAYVAAVDGPRPGDAAALQTFIERWVGYGRPGDMQSGIWRISNKPKTGAESSRFTVVRFEAVEDTSLGATCVRYSADSEERGNPQAHGSIFVIEEGENYACLHPSSPDQLIMIGYSERYIKDRRPGPSLVQTLKPELESFMRGIRFDPAG